MRLVTKLRHNRETSWLSSCDSMALQESVKDLNRAFRNFFEGRAAYPKFHRKGAPCQSYRTRNQGGGIRILDNRHIHIPVIGTLKAKVSRIPNGKILNATVSLSPTGKYHISLSVEEELVPKPNAGQVTGIDVGLKEFYTDSNGNIVDNPRPLAKYEKQLRREQRRLSRMIEANISGYAKNRKPVFRRPLSECRNILRRFKNLSAD